MSSDMRGSSAMICDERCGCPSPCPGGVGCRCASSSEEEQAHKQCPCGEHCGCNPCTTCSKTEMMTGGTGKAFCRCGDDCTCPTCTAAA